VLLSLCLCSCMCALPLPARPQMMLRSSTRYEYAATCTSCSPGAAQTSCRWWAAPARLACTLALLAAAGCDIAWEGALRAAGPPCVGDCCCCHGKACRTERVASVVSAPPLFTVTLVDWHEAPGCRLACQHAVFA
jgi:hypothetical protein